MHEVSLVTFTWFDSHLQSSPSLLYWIVAPYVCYSNKYDIVGTDMKIVIGPVIRDFTMPTNFSNQASKVWDLEKFRRHSMAARPPNGIEVLLNCISEGRLFQHSVHYGDNEPDSGFVKPQFCRPRTGSNQASTRLYLAISCLFMSRIGWFLDLTVDPVLFELSLLFRTGSYFFWGLMKHYRSSWLIFPTLQIWVLVFTVC